MPDSPPKKTAKLLVDIISTSEHREAVLKDIKLVLDTPEHQQMFIREFIAACTSQLQTVKPIV